MRPTPIFPVGGRKAHSNFDSCRACPRPPRLPVIDTLVSLPLCQARVCTLLQENMVVIGNIRENIVMGRFLDNHSLMINFDKNVKEVTALLATLPFAEMQKLPVQV